MACDAEGLLVAGDGVIVPAEAVAGDADAVQGGRSHVRARARIRGQRLEPGSSQSPAITCNGPSTPNCIASPRSPAPVSGKPESADEVADNLPGIVSERYSGSSDTGSDRRVLAGQPSLAQA